MNQLGAAKGGGAGQAQVRVVRHGGSNETPNTAAAYQAAAPQETGS